MAPDPGTSEVHSFCHRCCWPLHSLWGGERDPLEHLMAWNILNNHISHIINTLFIHICRQVEMVTNNNVITEKTNRKSLSPWVNYIQRWEKRELVTNAHAHSRVKAVLYFTCSPVYLRKVRDFHFFSWEWQKPSRLSLGWKWNRVCEIAATFLSMHQSMQVTGARTTNGENKKIWASAQRLCIPNLLDSNRCPCQCSSLV